jgi:hypothetical protein
MPCGPVTGEQKPTLTGAQLRANGSVHAAIST